MDATLNRLGAERLAELSAGTQPCPLQVTISFSGHEINLGLGSDETFVMIGTEPFDDWYYASSGKEAGREEKMFFGACQDSYWPARWLIPSVTAREAVRYFVEQQERSPNLKWDR